ncbi:hypothetical protein [Pseudomonas putida]|uniref:Uncharacterized protein n=1 Tax=Pseudomonas putida TaxID=303 RepID=A0A7V8EFS0_PSEPU|nr:hypothetical protein [Pseudomonas putida]KAF0254038.1 hypothetical protein GN299_15325 [Pseudomonas putida]
MCDEDSSFTERARAWLKADEPTQEQIQNAYSKMLAKLEKNPELANPDTDSCLELLVSAYRGVGGSEDELLATVEAAKLNQPQHQSVDVGARLDLGNLYEVGDGPAVQLTPEQKRDAFSKLKAEFGGMRASTDSGSDSSTSVF